MVTHNLTQNRKSLCGNNGVNSTKGGLNPERTAPNRPESACHESADKLQTRRPGGESPRTYQSYRSSLNFGGFDFVFCAFSEYLFLGLPFDPSRDPYGISERSGLESGGEGLHVYAVLQCQDGECVSIGYNRGKLESPVFARGLRFLLVLFPSIFPQKIGIARVAKK